MARGIVLAALASTALTVPAWAAVIDVGPGQSITAAIDRARPGDTVRVADGTYGAFRVNRSGTAGAPIRIVSANPGGARINGGSDRAITAFGENYIHIEGFRVRTGGSADGIYVAAPNAGGDPNRYLRGVRIANNIVETAGEDGIKLSRIGQGSQIVGNRVEWAGASGPAGGPGNGNGDGGIDCVTCYGVLFEGNRVRTQGHAALMLKTNSRNNTIRNNVFENADPLTYGKGGVAMTIGGVSGDVAARDEGVLGDAGSESHDNLVEGNTLIGTRCAFSFMDGTNNRLVNNTIRQRQDCPTQTADNNANVTPRGTPPSGTGATPVGGGGSSGGGIVVGGGLGTIDDNLENTDEAIWRAIDGGTSRAWREITDILSGGGIARGVNRGINTATGTVTRGIRRGVNGTVDTVTQPVEDAVDAVSSAISCAVGGTVMGGVGSVLSGIFGGGRATIGGQLAGMAVDAAGNLCEARQLSVQKELLKYAMLDNEGGEADPSAGIGDYLSTALPEMEAGGFLASGEDIVRDYDEAYPAMFDAMSPDDLIDTDEDLSRSARRAEMLSFQVGNRALGEQAQGLARSVEYAAMGREGPGIRAELQAGNAIQTEQVAAMNGLTAAQVAASRATAEVRLKEEAGKKAADRAAEDFMSGLARCDGCDLSGSLLDDN